MKEGRSRVHERASPCLYVSEGLAPGRPSEGDTWMDLIIVSTLTAFFGVVLRGIAAVELMTRLRCQERQQRARFCYILALARTLPRGCRLDEVRADGSELHLVVTHGAELTERP